MQPSVSRPLQLPAIFRRKAIAIAKSQTGVVQWQPKKALTAEDYPPPSRVSYRQGREPVRPPRRTALGRFFFFSIMIVATGMPLGIIYSKMMSSKNKNYAALYPDLFEGLEDDDDDEPPASPGSLPPTLGEITNTVAS